MTGHYVCRPGLEKRRQALLQDKFSETRKLGGSGVGEVPPPVARVGRLRSFAQAEALHIEGAAAAVTPQRPAPAPTPAPSERARRKAKQQAEMCEILATAVKPEGRVKLGDLLADIGRKVKMTDEEMAVFDRDHSPARAASFE